ncbi:hypothetical protein [Planctomicrobium sp. SH664]|uniref:hypothetical protein n=1 Tax=Planctomicrobium sp. SH664 TaxID=3448125 RepID=UPI003F5BD31D
MSVWSLSENGLLPIATALKDFADFCYSPEHLRLAERLRTHWDRPSIAISRVTYEAINTGSYGEFSRLQIVVDQLNRIGYSADREQLVRRIETLISGLRKWEDAALEGLDWRESDISIAKYENPSVSVNMYDLFGEELCHDLGDITEQADETSRWIQLLVATIRGKHGQGTQKTENQARSTPGDQPGYLGLSVDRARGEVRRVGFKPTVYLGSESAALHMFLVAFNAGEKGATTEELLKNYPADQRSTHRANVKRNVNNKLHVLDVRLKLGSSLVLEEIPPL